MRKKGKQFSMIIGRMMAVVLIFSSAAPAFAVSTIDELPLTRGPGVTQEALEAYAESQGRSTLTDQLEMLRPGADSSTRLNRMIERAQTSWLSGSIEAARSSFKEIARQALEADWREPQRESIHYAMMRLAQSAPSPSERDEWLTRAINSFPDLQPDSDLIPPPVMDVFHALHARLLGGAISYQPARQFPEYRFLYLNGKKYTLTADLKIRLPKGTFRVTALSDAYPPVTEKLTTSQMEVFRLSLPALATGTCAAPSGEASIDGVPNVAVFYGVDCVRVRQGQTWLPKNVDVADLAGAAIAPSVGDFGSTTAFEKETSEGLKAPTANTSMWSGKKPWILGGIAIVAAGAAYALARHYAHEAGGEAHVVPTQTRGF